MLCNHQRAVPKTHEKSMENLDTKFEGKQEAIEDAEKKLKHAKKAYKSNGSQVSLSILSFFYHLMSRRKGQMLISAKKK